MRFATDSQEYLLVPCQGIVLEVFLQEAQAQGWHAVRMTVATLGWPWRAPDALGRDMLRTVSWRCGGRGTGSARCTRARGGISLPPRHATVLSGSPEES